MVGAGIRRKSICLEKQFFQRYTSKCVCYQPALSKCCSRNFLNSAANRPSNRNAALISLSSYKRVVLSRQMYILSMKTRTWCCTTGIGWLVWLTLSWVAKAVKQSLTNRKDWQWFVTYHSFLRQIYSCSASQKCVEWHHGLCKWVGVSWRIKHFRYIADPLYCICSFKIVEG